MSTQTAPRSFISYEDRIKQQEEELEKLLKGEGTPVEEEQTEVPQEQTAVVEEEEELDQEEKSFKKRYGDLRKHLAKKSAEYEQKIRELENSTRNAELPVDPETVTAWIEDNPQVAKIVQEMARKIASEEVQDLREQRQENQRNKLLETIKAAHKDFDEISAADEFHDWMEEQPKALQDAVYENGTDAKAVIRVLDLYKADKGKPKAKRDAEKGAASLVNTKARTTPSEGAGEYLFSESMVNKMTMKEYAEKEDEINKAIRNKKFLYDISGAAR